MTLEIARSSLRNRLLEGDTAFDLKEQMQTIALIKMWWSLYRAWEEKDTFLKAFKDGRMTVRQGPRISEPDEGLYGSYGGKTSTGGFKAGGTSYPDERYRTGMDSVKERLNPANFSIDGGERLKYKRGLHDLSASLCAPAVPLITKQVRWKFAGEGGKLSKWATIFTPMAQPADHSLFILLRLMAKRLRQAAPEVHRLVREIGLRMTRIKLAAAEDIGAGLSDVSFTGSPKFKYGLKGEGDLDFGRWKNTLDYTSILPKPPESPSPHLKTQGIGSSGPPPPPPPTKDTNTNEIVICYREHAGTRFPLFTAYDGRRFVCLESEASSRWIVNGVIPDRWATTVELQG